MRSILLALMLVVAADFNAPASVLYTFSEPSSPPGDYPTPAINLSFTVPSLLTSSTVIPGSSVNSPVIPYMGLDLSILSVNIDPGIDTLVPWIRIAMGRNGQLLFGEGACFVPDTYACTPSPAAKVFDHFGTYTSGDMTLTISSEDAAVAAVPEPRHEAGFGLIGLLIAVGIARRSRILYREHRTAE